MMIALQEAKEYIENTDICLECKHHDDLMCRSCDLTDAIKLLWELIENRLKYKWHDLRNRPNDLPKNNKKVLVAFRHFFDVEEIIILWHTEEGWMCDLGLLNGKAIAWREIEPFEVKE